MTDTAPRCSNLMMCIAKVISKVKTCPYNYPTSWIWEDTINSIIYQVECYLKQPQHITQKGLIAEIIIDVYTNHIGIIYLIITDDILNKLKCIRMLKPSSGSIFKYLNTSNILKLMENNTLFTTIDNKFVGNSLVDLSCMIELEGQLREIMYIYDERNNNWYGIIFDEECIRHYIISAQLRGIL